MSGTTAEGNPSSLQRCHRKGQAADEPSRCGCWAFVFRIGSFPAKLQPEQVTDPGQRGNEDNSANDQTFRSEVFRRWFRPMHHLLLLA
jgi:hypothetical protein